MIGKVEFDNAKVSLPLISLSLRNGKIEYIARGNVNPRDIPDGEVTWVLRGEDNLIVAMGKHNAANLFSEARRLKASHITFSHSIIIEVAGGF